MYDLVIKNGKLVTPDRIYEANIAVKNGKFAAFLSADSEIEAKQVIDAKGNLVYPGIIDCHAHMNEPGFNYREDFETGSRAAVSAGCTTLIDMPLNNDPSLINKDVFKLKHDRISQHSYIDFALWGGIVGDYDDSPDSIKSNVNDLADLEACGVAAFKGFTCPNGDLFPTVNLGNVRKALEILKPFNALSGFHCEEFGQVKERVKEAKAKQGLTEEQKIREFLDAHDVWVEYVATKNIIDMSRATGGRVHICHVTHPMVAQLVKDAIYEGLPVSGETCPHYLGFTEDFVFEQGGKAKCTPPLRKREDMEKLWDYVLDGTLSCIGSDHSPAADYEKDNATKDIWQAWGGLNSIQFFLPMVFDMVVHQRKFSPTLIAKVMGYNPAKLFGLYGQKGAFELGFDADIVIVDPEKEWKVEQEKLFTKGHVTCFNGLTGKGAAVYTIIRGKVVAENGVYKEDAIGYGKFVKPTR
ncbi:allantoinase [Cricetibacter osteomyelitidis]|uniref:allantoinase n=1 Tax=Cricetibacter osteomyelitidis TaxID=1521931 RepID=A0A4R2T2K8_9PAST|nr:allantoinase AllB [Cricetibacter osteomyelitidis]TCP96205.1 allantoinase [Cricetibacter osteomyelitidis]